MIQTKKYLILILVSAFCSDAFAQPVVRSMKRLPDTGQTISFTTTPGEDSDYSINTPDYLNNGNGTVTDTVTGLMWQSADGGEMTIENATLFCDTLTLAGYSDWRLPTAHELFSILDHNTTNPALNTTYFPATAAEYWWSSQRQSGDSSKVWVTNAGGGVGNHPKSETISAGGPKHFHVRAVRDVTTPLVIPNHFIDNGNATVTDALTGLIWQQIPFSDSLTWEDALLYADTLSLAGQSDWRLPNIKELQSLNDEQRISPSVNTNYFNTIGVKHYWASTSLPNQPLKAWYLDTHFGVTTYATKTDSLNLICVRGGSVISGLAQNPTGNQKLIISGNLTGGEIRLNCDVTMLEFSVFDLQGKEIVRLPVNGTEFTVHLQLQGIFIMRVRTMTGLISRKVMINK